MSQKNSLLSWKSKNESLRLALRPSNKEFIVDTSRTNPKTNMRFQFFEGDNLDVLKALQKNNQSSVNLAFVDPPYNSRNDFIKNDSPTKTPSYWNSGVSHERWLEMMHPRLVLVHELLQEERGLLIATIDEKEFPYFKILLDNIFGEKNFVGTIIWKSMEGIKSNASFTFNHTYCLIYAKNFDKYKQFHSQSKFGLSNTYQLNRFESVWTDLSSSVQARTELLESLNKIIPEQYFRFLNPKPLDLLHRILSLSALQESDVVLDLFAGTGSLFCALMQYSHLIRKEFRYFGIQYPLKISELIKKQNPEIVFDPKITIFDLLVQRVTYELGKKHASNPNFPSYFIEKY
ncbi:DNA methyltransferase [Candidatus Lokiarchaeum ossiferum]|uniref:DNA methyltransferase n=1 Tax=Candidatus Lokiarchaeum ossiferum TaxID=2951803 RepID=UPI00352D1FBB